MSPVTHIEEIFETEFTSENRARGHFEARIGLLGKALGSRRLGINITEVPPGKRAWPRHYHFINDELFFVVSGTGTFRHGEDAHPLRPGSVAYAQGGSGIPFQMVNTGDEPLRYLAISSMEPADVFHYVDADKYGIMANAAPFRSMEGTTFRRWIAGDHEMEYWAGEPGAED